MPVNFLWSLLHRLQWGWDPISREYAEDYARRAWEQPCDPVIDRIEAVAGTLAGMRILDLGAGAGQYSVLMAQRKASVVWHDPSHEYERIARERAQTAGVTLEFSIGYLEDAVRFAAESFDVVFCRLCWYYCRSDRRFARLIYSLLKPGGIGYVECNTPAFANLRGFRKFQSLLNEWTWWKIGHPLPPHGRIGNLFHRYSLERMLLDYSSDVLDTVLFFKKRH